MILDGEDLAFEAEMQALVRKCAESRVYFVEAVLGLELEQWQLEVLQALDNGEKKISIRSGNGVGKTFLCAIMALHFLLFRDDVKVVVTSPSAKQLKDGLISESVKWLSHCPAALRSQIQKTEDRMVRIDSPDTNFVSFRTARRENPEALQGIHAKHVLLIVDEASGVDEAVYEAGQGALSTAGAIVVLISNPTRLSGYFYNTHHKLAHRWRKWHLSSFDTTNVDQEFVDMISETYGIDSDQYRVKVLGEFPSRDIDSLIARDCALAAIKRDIVPSGGNKYWGLDVGRGGDPSALIERQGNAVTCALEWNIKDGMATVGVVKDKWDSTDEDDRPEAILVDSIGVGGPIADRLRELGLPAFDVNVSEIAPLKIKYFRLRDQLWYEGKTWFETMDCVITEDVDAKLAEKFVNEVSTPTSSFTSTGKDKVESKAEMKRRGEASPNLADAFIMTFALEGAIAGGVGYSKAKNDWNTPLDYGAPSVY